MICKFCGERMEDIGGMASGLRCPNCGATACSHCGTQFEKEGGQDD